jgi:hypothetical protein
MGNKVQGIIELSGKEINNEIVCTTGFQMTKVLQIIKEDLLNCIWYCGDISTNCNIFDDSSKSRKEYFKLEDTEQLMKFAMQIDQFLSGVFLAIPKSICHPNLEYNFDTERESTTDLGDAILEIRAFDTSFFEFYSSRTEITERLTEYFK